MDFNKVKSIFINNINLNKNADIRLMQSKFRYLVKSNLGAAALIVFGCFLLQHIPNLLALLIRQNVLFQQESRFIFEAPLSNLENGNYYIAVGTAYNDYEIFLDDQILIQNKGFFSKKKKPFY